MLNKEKIISIVVAVMLFTFGYLLVKDNSQYAEDQIDELSNEIVHSQALILERSIKRSTSSAVILGNHIHALNGDMTDFEEYAKDLYTLLGGITNLQLAPNGIISKIYPLKGHEKALGHDIFKSDTRKKEAFLARKSRKLTLAGPFTLIQGGVAIIARNPVYLEDKLTIQNNETHIHSKANKFWGFSSTLILLEDLLNNTDIHQLKEKNYLYRLWRYHPDTNKIDVFSGEQNLPKIKVFTKSIKVPNGKWYLDIEYIGTSLSVNSMKIFQGINFFVSILLGYLLYVVLNRPKELQLEVALKTHELKKLSNAVTYNSNAIFIANKDGTVEYINPAFEAMTGYTFDDLYNEETDLFQEEIGHVIKDKQKWSGQGTHTKKNKEKFVSITTITLVKDHEHNITSYVGVCEDITQKLKDDEVIQEKEILLLQQSKMASIGEMFENIAHQWMQPLNGILTMSTGLKMLKESDALPDQVLLDHLDNIADNVEHLA
ncbi:MAG: PAS domain-containing protein, partial [Campylobacteraceae bacterium]|nr:PAS domain-containing protein [Campylobacteraceae bacterium]